MSISLPVNLIPFGKQIQASVRLMKTAFKLETSPINLPWFAFNRSSTNINQLHQLSRKFVKSRFQKYWVLFAPIWLLGSVFHPVLAIRKNGHFVNTTYKVSLFQQFLDQIILKVSQNINADSYYKFRLFQPENKTRAGQFVQHDEICNLLPTLNSGIDVKRVNDKLRFFENSIQYSLPTPEVVAAFESGQVHKWYRAESEDLPQVDLISKPTNIYCGIGVLQWHYVQELDGWQCEDKVWSQQALIQEVKRLSLESGSQYLLQHKATNHVAIQQLAGRGVSTVRLVTYMDQGSPHFLIACFRMPTGESFVDNFAAGGIASPVYADGTLGSATAKDIRLGNFDRHPDTGAVITGAQLPYWSETIHQALEAHRCFHEIPFIGWDIIITDVGPLLLEANVTWCVELLQQSHGMPLGETVFPQVFLEHYRSKV
jgi:Sugar-transfer associated ATP-grasp